MQILALSHIGLGVSYVISLSLSSSSVRSYLRGPWSWYRRCEVCLTSECSVHGNVCFQSRYDHCPSYWMARSVFSVCQLVLSVSSFSGTLDTRGDRRWVQVMTEALPKSSSFFPFPQPFSTMVVTAWNTTARALLIYFRLLTPVIMQNSSVKKTRQAAFKHQYLSVDKCQVLYRKPVFLEWNKSFQARMRVMWFEEQSYLLISPVSISFWLWLCTHHRYTWTCLGMSGRQSLGASQLPRDTMTTEHQTLLLTQLKLWLLKTKSHSLSFFSFLFFYPIWMNDSQWSISAEMTCLRAVCESRIVVTIKKCTGLDSAIRK